MSSSKLLTAALGVGALAAAGAAAYYAVTKWKKDRPAVAAKPRKTRSLEYVSASSPVVVIDYADLLDATLDLSLPIEKAFGYEGLGLIVVRGVPEFARLRANLLPLANKFASLPEKVKDKYVHTSSAFSFGWSHGKEQFEGKPDFAKGSYYNNPLYDRPVDDEKLIQQFPTFASPNIWPKDDLPELEPAFKQLGKLIVEVGTRLAQHCDAYVKSKVPTYQPNRLTRCVTEGRCVKARLLHYFPVESPVDNNSPEDVGSWCGWHNDHGSLTGLVGAMYIKDGKEVPCPDPRAGLYIQGRQGQLVQAKWPSDALAFQMGETEQIHSGGILLATPHCVRAAANADAKAVSRETFAVFMEPMWGEKMDIPSGMSADDALRGTGRTYLPKGVPPLEKRWSAQDDFGTFTKKTVDQYTIY